MGGVALDLVAWRCIPRYGYSDAHKQEDAPGEDAVDGRELAGVGGDEAAHLREDRQHARLPQERRLAWLG